MAKMKKRKLRWKTSESQQVVSYRLYWAEGEKVSYKSPFAVLGNVTEVVLPDDVDGFSPKGGPIEFGVSAVDELGNESDLVTFAAPYQFNIPLAPEELWIESLDEFPSVDDETDTHESAEPIALFIKGRESGHPGKDDEPALPALEDEDDKAYKTIQHYGCPEKDR